MTAKDNGRLEIGSWEDAERAMAELAAAESSRRGVQAEIDSEIAAVHEQYREALEQRKKETAGLQAALSKFAKKHKRDLRARGDGGEVRSREHAGVMMGFRRTPPRVVIKHAEQAVAWLRQKFPLFVRTKYEPNREALLEELKRPESTLRDKFAGHGILLDSSDKFFCEVKEQK